MDCQKSAHVSSKRAEMWLICLESTVILHLKDSLIGITEAPFTIMLWSDWVHSTPFLALGERFKSRMEYSRDYCCRDITLFVPTWICTALPLSSNAAWWWTTNINNKNPSFRRPSFTSTFLLSTSITRFYKHCKRGRLICELVSSPLIAKNGKFSYGNTFKTSKHKHVRALLNVAILYVQAAKASPVCTALPPVLSYQPLLPK